MSENKKKPNPIDVHVGGRIRMRRNAVAMSQEKLGEKLGITFQQVQKYEKGTNRVGASRLQDIASVLSVPPAFFFENAPSREPSGGVHHLAESAANFAMASCGGAEGVQLNRAFARIAKAQARTRVIALVRALAAGDDG